MFLVQEQSRTKYINESMCHDMILVFAAQK